MGNTCGSLNTAGFTASVISGNLPHFDHITYAGAFNQNFFEVGNKAKHLFEIHHGLAVSNCDLADMPKRNFFISLFNKSSADGEKRNRPINVVLCLDVSGSMDGPLKQEYPRPANIKTRLDLSRDAIWMFFEKLSPNDVFSMVTFHNTAQTIIPSNLVSELNKETVKQAIYSKFQSGGTTIKEGFNESMKNIETFRKGHTLTGYEHRIVLLTDVCDNSVANENELIEEISATHNVGTTIIGVSTDFQSKTCQKLVDLKGFNYFCAVQNSDLQTYLADQFDYTFFPCIANAEISIESDVIESIKVYGSPDHNVTYEKEGDRFIVTKMKTGFPSDISHNKQGNLQTKGGLILVKFQPKKPEKLFDIDLTIGLKYEDLQGKVFTTKYVAKMKMQAEQFYSDEAIKKGANLFYFTDAMRTVLQQMHNGGLSDDTREMFLEKLGKLNEYCPKEKIGELEKVIEIVGKKEAHPSQVYK